MNINKRIKDILISFAVVIFWLVVWQMIAMAVDRELILASPIAVSRRLLFLLTQGSFYIAILNSLAQIGLGYLLGIFAGVALAFICYYINILYRLFNP